MVYRDKRVTYPNGTTDYDYYCVDAIGPPATVEAPPASDRFSRDLLSGRIEATLLTEQPLLIGSGEVEVEDGGNISQRLQFARIHGRNELVVPGSSLKGVIRTYAEALSPSCRAVTDRCQSCPVCAIFGSTGGQGRFGFADALLDRGVRTRGIPIKQRRAPTQECLGRKFYYFDYPQRPQDPHEEKVEVVPTNTAIACTAAFLNLANWELGLVLLAMGLGCEERVKPFSLKLGGGKNRKLGKARFLPDKLEVISIDKRAELESRVNGKEYKPAQLELKKLTGAYIEKAREYAGLIAEIADKFQRGAPDAARTTAGQGQRTR